MDLIERLINKDYLTERERKEWLGTIKERLEALKKENKELKEIIEIRKQMNINLIDFSTKLKQENEKLKKAIEIFKTFISVSKEVNFDTFITSYCDDDVFDLLKEVIKNE